MPRRECAGAFLLLRAGARLEHHAEGDRDELGVAAVAVDLDVLGFDEGVEAGERKLHAAADLEAEAPVVVRRDTGGRIARLIRAESAENVRGDAGSLRDVVDCVTREVPGVEALAAGLRAPV